MSKITVSVPSHVELTIRRPNGGIEIVNGPAHIRSITTRQFADIQAAYSRSGKGEALSYANITKEVTESDEDYASRIHGQAMDALSESSRKIAEGMAYGERDESASHGSRSEPTHKSDMEG